MNFKFLKSAQQRSDWPQETVPEVAFAGRSNSGKSSLLNAWSGNRRLAKVSGQPGKTRLLNFFAAGERYHLVDMPGYGYAVRSATERDSWGAMIEGYIAHRSTLKGLILVMDVRRKWSADEDLLHNWVNSQGLEVVLVLNKVDKLNARERQAREKQLKTELAHLKRRPAVFWTSAAKKQGVKEVDEYVFQHWVCS